MAKNHRNPLDLMEYDRSSKGSNGIITEKPKKLLFIE